MNDDILIALKDMISAIVDYPVVIGSVPPLNGFAVCFVGGAPFETYRKLDKSVPLPVLFNGKGADQQVLSAQMNLVHDLLTTSKALPRADNWQIYAIRTTAYPNLIGREENKNWIYGSSFAIDYYSKGVE